jgi:hypothetical protein
MIERAKRRGLVNLRAVVIAHYLDPNHDDVEEMEIVTKGLIISTASTNKLSPSAAWHAPWSLNFTYSPSFSYRREALPNVRQSIAQPASRTGG